MVLSTICISVDTQDPLSPDDDDDTVKDIVGVAKVIKETKSSKFQDHLQGKHACKDNVADLQDVGQFLWLGRRQIQSQNWKSPETVVNKMPPFPFPGDRLGSELWRTMSEIEVRLGRAAFLFQFFPTFTTLITDIMSLTN